MANATEASTSMAPHFLLLPPLHFLFGICCVGLTRGGLYCLVGHSLIGDGKKVRGFSEKLKLQSDDGDDNAFCSQRGCAAGWYAQLTMCFCGEKWRVFLLGSLVKGTIYGQSLPGARAKLITRSTATACMVWYGMAVSVLVLYCWWWCDYISDLVQQSQGIFIVQYNTYTDTWWIERRK